MLGGGLIGLLAALFVAVIGTAFLKRRPIPLSARRMFVIGMWLRVAGALFYLFFIGAMYGGGDYFGYYYRGIGFAEALWKGDYDSFLGIFELSRWWGTAFTVWLTGWVLAFLGPTLPGAFIVFALAGYVGVLSLGHAFARAFPKADWRRYLMFIMLFPSLWFWPTPVGKDAIVLCGVGVATLGFVGHKNRIRWSLTALGIFLVFVIRPQVAATLVFAIMAGQWLGALKRWNAKSLLQAILLLGAGIGVITMAGGQLGVDLFDTDEIESYLAGKGAVSARGGSVIQAADTATPWLGPVNTLFRPFPWEASGGTVMLAAAEVIVIWGLVWYRRRAIVSFVRAYKGNRVFWMAVVFIAAYATALGMAIGNIGIIARQRVHILPFLFMFMAGMPKTRRRTAKAGSRVPKSNHPSTSRMRPPAGIPANPRKSPAFPPARGTDTGPFRP
jgi:hypothetical protein